MRTHVTLTAQGYIHRLPRWEKFTRGDEYMYEHGTFPGTNIRRCPVAHPRNPGSAMGQTPHEQRRSRAVALGGHWAPRGFDPPLSPVVPTLEARVPGHDGPGTSALNYAVQRTA